MSDKDRAYKDGEARGKAGVSSPQDFIDRTFSSSSERAAARRGWESGRHIGGVREALREHREASKDAPARSYSSGSSSSDVSWGDSVGQLAFVLPILALVFGVVVALVTTIAAWLAQANPPITFVGVAGASGLLVLTIGSCLWFTKATPSKRIVGLLVGLVPVGFSGLLGLSAMGTSYIDKTYLAKADPLTVTIRAGSWVRDDWGLNDQGGLFYRDRFVVQAPVRQRTKSNAELLLSKGSPSGRYRFAILASPPGDIHAAAIWQPGSDSVLRQISAQVNGTVPSGAVYWSPDEKRLLILPLRGREDQAIVIDLTSGQVMTTPIEQKTKGPCEVQVLMNQPARWVDHRTISFRSKIKARKGAGFSRCSVDARTVEVRIGV